MRLIDVGGEQLGVVALTEALARAEAKGLDLAEIAPQANPPVAKILDWGKYSYEQTKQQQKSRKKQRSIEVKQVRLSLKIGEHDIDVKHKQAERFLQEGSKVKISLLLRGREITHRELGQNVIQKFATGLAEHGEIEQAIQLTGRELNMVMGAKKNA